MLYIIVQSCKSTPYRKYNTIYDLFDQQYEFLIRRIPLTSPNGKEQEWTFKVSLIQQPAHLFVRIFKNILCAGRGSSVGHTCRILDVHYKHHQKCSYDASSFFAKSPFRIPHRRQRSFRIHRLHTRMKKTKKCFTWNHYCICCYEISGTPIACTDS